MQNVRNRLAKAASAEVAVRQRHEKWHPVVARSTFVGSSSSSSSSNSSSSGSSASGSSGSGSSSRSGSSTERGTVGG